VRQTALETQRRKAQLLFEKISLDSYQAARKYPEIAIKMKKLNEEISEMLQREALKEAKARGRTVTTTESMAGNRKRRFDAEKKH